MEFLLPWLLDMQAGAYPVEPTGGYIEGKRSGISSHAFYEAACQVAAEIDRRLAMCGLDHYLVIDSYCHGLTDEQIARRNWFTVWEVQHRIHNAVSYISSGTCPRWLDCSGCGEEQDCRKLKRMRELGKVRQVYTYQDWKLYKNKEEGRKLKYTKKV